jgi:hypothetical protein
MAFLAQIDGQKLFVPEQPVLDSVIRGTIVYLMLFIVMRFLLKRRSGGRGMADVLVVVLIADAAQNAMGSEYRSVTEGALLVLTIVFWDRTIDWLGHQSVVSPVRRRSCSSRMAHCCVTTCGAR